MTHHATRPEGLAAESAGSTRVSYLSHAGHLVLVFRAGTCDSGCRGQDAFHWGACRHDQRAVMEPEFVVRVHDHHDRALTIFHDPACGAHDALRLLDEAGIAHDRTKPVAA